MSPDLINLLQVVAYLVLGTVGIVLVAAWMLKHFGPPKR
jgi:hypothetical protein